MRQCVQGRCRAELGPRSGRVGAHRPVQGEAGGQVWWGWPRLSQQPLLDPINQSSFSEAAPSGGGMTFHPDL